MASATVRDSNREAVQYVLSIKGTVHINEEMSDTRTFAELPREAFRLTRVDLGMNPRVDEAGLIVFDHCKHLRFLNLINTKVSNTEGAHFTNYKELEVTHHLPHGGGRGERRRSDPIRELKNLIHLAVARTEVTAAKIEALKKALPKCKITWDGGVIDPKEG